jgi:glycosyltransferase involved in cell wall biosynthesis
MRILYHLINFPKVSQTFIINEIRALVNRGHDVEVFALNHPDEEIQHDALEEISLPVKYVSQPWFRNLSSLVSGVVESPASLEKQTRLSQLERIKVLVYYNELLSYLRDDQSSEPDLIHSHFTVYDQLAGALVAQELDLPYTVTAHAYDIFTTSERVPEICPYADRVVTVTEYNRSFLKNNWEFDTPIDLVPACVDPEDFQPTERSVPNRVLTVGRLVEKKGISDAVQAIAKLVERIPDIKYHIVGKGHLESEIRDQIRDLGVSDHVDVLGTVSDDRLRRELDEAQVFVLPCKIALDGDRDSGPMVLKEAMAMETACVSTEISGIPEIIEDKKHGRLVPASDPDALAAAIVDLLEDEDERQKLAVAGRNRVEERFDVKKRISDLETTFSRAMADH